MKKYLSLMLTLVFALVLAACGPKTDKLLEEAKEDLTLVFKSGDSADSVTQNITLRTKGKHETTITWKSSDPDIIANDGTVTRPSWDEGDKEVTLTATITLKDKSVTKEFKVTVKALEKPVSVKLEEAYEELEIQFAVGDTKDAVTGNLTLPTKAGEATVTWQSSNPEYVSDSGEVKRPFFNDEVVTLTATLTIDGQTKTKTFAVTVKGITEDEMTDADKVQYVFDRLNISPEVTTAVIYLPKDGAYNVTITWEVDNEDIVTISEEIEESGYKVYIALPSVGSGEVKVKFTATLTLNDAELKKEFEVTLKEAHSGTISYVLGLNPDQNVIINEAIISGIVQDGYYIEDSTGALFVYTNVGNVPEGIAVGDRISISGTFTIYYNQPELTNASIIRTIDRGNDLPLEPEVVTIEQIHNWDLSDRTLYSKRYILEGIAIIKGSYNNVYLVSGDKEVVVYFRSSDGPIKEFEGEKIKAEFIFHTYHTGDKEYRFSFVGTKEDVELVEMTDEELFNSVYDSLQLPTSVTEDIDLPTEVSGVTISWHSDKPHVISTDGKVTRGEEDIEVTLTATLTYGDLEPKTKEFKVTVKKIQYVAIEDILSNSQVNNVFDVKGIVVGKFNQGFFLNDGTGFIFIFTGSAPTVERGDVVRLTGVFDIYNDQPELKDITNLNTIDDTFALPSAVTKSLADVVAFDPKDVSVYSIYLQLKGTVVTEQGSSRLEYYLVDEDNNKVRIYYRSEINEVAPYVDKEVTINVFIYRYHNSDKVWEVIFSGGDRIEVDMTDAERIQAIKDAIDALPKEVTTELVLPGKLFGVDVTWTSDNPAVIAIDPETGKVTINQPEGSDVIVTLTATFTVGETEVSEQIEVTVKKKVTQPQKISEARQKDKDEEVYVEGVVTARIGTAAFIQDETGGIYLYYGSTGSEYIVVGNKVRIRGTIDIYNNLVQIRPSHTELVETNVELPAPKVFNSIAELIAADVQGQLVRLTGLVIVEVQSPNQQGAYSVVLTDGEDIIQIRVDRKNYLGDHYVEPEQFIPGQVVNITAPLGQYLDNLQLMIADGSVYEIVNPTIAQTLIYAKYVLDLGDLSAVTGDLDLPTTIAGIDGVIITWSSSDPDVIASDGTVNRPAVGQPDAQVTLTATITYDEESVTKIFEVTVKAESNERVIYEENFEEGFTAGTNYQSTITDGPEGKKWTFYYGTVSTTNSIEGSQSAQMRWYTGPSHKNNLGYAVTNFTLKDVTKVMFSAKSPKGLVNVTVAYSFDGENFIDVETFELTELAQTFTANINVEGNIYLKFQLTFDEEPSERADLIIDEIVVYGSISE